MVSPSGYRHLFVVIFFIFYPIFSAWPEGVLLLPRPEEAAKVRLDLIADAKEEIWLSTYIFREDRVGLQVVASLCEAIKKRPNLKINLVLDGLNNSSLTKNVSPELIAYLSRAGINVYSYHPVSLLHPMRSNKRLHDKLFVVDGEHVILGDRNVAQEYYGLADNSRVSKDIYVQGDSAKKASNYFSELVSSKEVELLKPEKVSEDKLANIAIKVERFSKPKGIVKKLDDYGDWRKKVRQVEHTSFSHDPIGLKGKVPGVEVEILNAIRQAKSRIVIENAYIVLTPEFKKALKEAADRNVKIEVLTNSSDSTNKQIVAAAWEESRKFLAQIGASVWEHPGTKQAPLRQRIRNFGKNISRMETMIHSKTMVIDDAEVFIMSYNIDPRSEKLNTEVVEHVVDKNIAQELNTILETEKKEFKYIQTITTGAVTGSTRECSTLFKMLSRIVSPHL